MPLVSWAAILSFLRNQQFSDRSLGFEFGD